MLIRLMFICIIVMLFLVGCSSEELQQLEQTNKELEVTKKIFSENEGSQEIFEKIEVGMSMDDVKKIAGEPLKKTQMENEYTKTEIWYYAGKIQVMFWEGYVKSKAKY